MRVRAGVGYTDDKLLQTRIFSYADTQRHRLGPNYLLLPVNAPKCPHHNNHHEGFMNFMHRDEEVNYFPSRCEGWRAVRKWLCTRAGRGCGTLVTLGAAVVFTCMPCAQV